MVTLNFIKLLFNLGSAIVAMHGYWLYKTLYRGDIRNRISLLAEPPIIYLLVFSAYSIFNTTIAVLRCRIKS